MGQEKSLPDRYCSAPDLKYQNSCHHLNNKNPLGKTYSESAYFNRRIKKIANDRVVKKPVSPTTSASGSSSGCSSGGDRLSRSDKLTSPLGGTPLRSQSSSSTSCSNCYTPSTSTATTDGSRSSVATSDKSADRQKEYLKQHLYIKSYLDILEDDRKAKKQFKPARPGIRNYKPKILSEKEREKTREKDKDKELWI